MFRHKNSQGFSFIELLVVMGIIVIMGGVTLINLLGRRNTVELNATTQKMAALLREAQSRSAAQASSSGWGVRFDNTSTTNPFYSLFSGTYSVSSRENVYALPANLRFTTSTVAAGGYAEATFSQLSGRSTGSSTIGIYSLNSPLSPATITIGPSGSVSY